MNTESIKSNFPRLRIQHICAVLFITALCASNGEAAAPGTSREEAFLDAPLHELNVRRGDDAFFALCHAIGHPCGEEEAKPNDMPVDADVHLTKTTPRQVLDDIVKKHPEYQWALRDGALNLEPKSRPGEDVLSRKLAAVSIQGDSSLKAILDVLHQAYIQFSYQPLSTQRRYARINLEFKNVSVREVLNSIAKSDGKLIWRFSLTSGDFSGTLLVLSWSKSGVLFSNDERNKVKEWLGRKKAAK